MKRHLKSGDTEPRDCGDKWSASRPSRFTSHYPSDRKLSGPEQVWILWKGKEPFASAGNRTMIFWPSSPQSVARTIGVFRPQPRTSATRENIWVKCYRHIITRMEWLQPWFYLVIGFTQHLKLETTGKDYAVTVLHTAQFNSLLS
jgi:hypothetical protein